MKQEQNRGEQRKASPAAIQKHLKGVDYPADKEALVHHAQEHGAGADVMSVLKRLPQEKWDTPAQLMKAVGKVE